MFEYKPDRTDQAIIIFIMGAILTMVMVHVFDMIIK